MSKEIYIAILRGINVSGSNMIKMPALQKSLEAMGLKSVKTYIQSGNILFEYEKSAAEELSRQIKETIKKDFGLDVPVLIITWKDLKSVFENNPFVQAEKDIAALHVTFLAGEAEPEKLEKIEAGKYLPDEFIAAGNVIYLFCNDGYGRTKLNNNFFENKLKVTATTRNWKTVTTLVQLCETLTDVP